MTSVVQRLMVGVIAYCNNAESHLKRRKYKVPQILGLWNVCMLPRKELLMTRDLMTWAFTCCSAACAVS